ncbi:MAG: MBOAT family protein, partial [Erysipelotrichaceae bacterium]|nr:MBOAT family protein [Erysipelotrichaceae bacterium]
YDFSGYSDMAIGIGHMLGFDIIENFKQPYQAKGIQDFWRRWHISLSRWFRDYVYIPLGGNRKGSIHTIGNMLVVWLLTGIWHGFDWTFIIWGLGHYLLLLAERFVPFVKSVATGTFSHLYTLFLVNLLWIPFRAENIKCLASYMRGILSFKGTIEDIATGFWPLMAIGIILLLIPNKLIEKAEKNKTCQIIKTIILAVLFFYAICALLNATYTPYIYGNF